MSGVLVSVRSAAEAELALAAGVDLIDVKEPSLGSLGAADLDTIAQIVQRIAGRAPVSAALGELCDFRPSATLEKLPGLAFAKLGLAGCRELSQWQNRWRDAIAAFPAGAAPVAVAYADWRTAGSLSPEAVLDVGVQLGCRALLVDTHDKSRGGLFTHLLEGDLRRLAGEARRHGLTFVLAGSLRAKDVPAALGALPDFLAFRGAACGKDRGGDLRADLLATLVESVRASVASASARC